MHKFNIILQRYDKMELKLELDAILKVQFFSGY